MANQLWHDMHLRYGVDESHPYYKLVMACRAWRWETRLRDGYRILDILKRNHAQHIMYSSGWSDPGWIYNITIGRELIKIGKGESYAVPFVVKAVLENHVMDTGFRRMRMALFRAFGISMYTGVAVARVYGKASDEDIARWRATEKMLRERRQSLTSPPKPAEPT